MISLTVSDGGLSLAFSNEQILVIWIKRALAPETVKASGGRMIAHIDLEVFTETDLRGRGFKTVRW